MQPDTNHGLSDIHDILRRLGVTPNYIGFHHTSLAVSFIMQQPERLMLITKLLYPEVARHYHTSCQCVERNIRTVSQIAWRSNRPLLEKITRRSLPSRPAVSHFLAILASYISPDT